MGDGSLGDGVWLYASVDRQALILTRESEAGQRELRYVPVANLAQDAGGAIHFERCAWDAGLPLALWEDPDVVTDGEKSQWLADWHSESAWLMAVHRSKYSNGLIGLTEQLLDAPPSTIPPDDLGRDRLRTDLLIFANDHWNFNVRGFNPGGNHGSLLRASTHSVLMMAGGGTGLPEGLSIAAPYDSLSFVPTILALMGRAEADLPGPLIEEIWRK